MPQEARQSSPVVGIAPVNRFVHPGLPTYPRIVEAEAVTRSEEIRISVPPGANVGQSIRSALSGRATTSGCGRIVGGSCGTMQYHVITKTSEGAKPYAYGAPIVCATGDSTLVSAAITLGCHINGSQIIHSHGGFVDADGKQHGGHVVLDQCIAGADGLVVRLCLFSDVELIVAPDRETTFDLLSPRKKG